MALSFTQTDLDNAKAALVSGAMEVRVGDRIIKYRSQSDIINLIQAILQYLDGVNVTDTPNVVSATYSKGVK
jgi:hypothetical protein